MDLTKQLQRATSNLESLGQVQFTIPTWLIEAVTPKAVYNGLLQQIPEFASGQLTLIDCDIKRLRLRTGEECWSGVCLLTIGDASAKSPWTVALYSSLIPPQVTEPHVATDHQPFGTAQWRCYLPDLRLELSMQAQETELAALPELTNPIAAQRLLEVSIQASGNAAYHNLRIQSCQPKVMRYKPGSRCTILYHLQYPSTLAAENTWPEVVVAKTHHGNKGQIAYESMVALWQSPMRTSRTVTIAEPLAYISESRVLVQGPIREEMTLKDLVEQMLSAAGNQDNQSASLPMHELYCYLRKTAVGLAELHQCGVRYGEAVTWEDELADIYTSRSTLTTVLPQFTNFADGLLERLHHLATMHPADTLAPAHRSFRPAQVLLYKGEIGFIDFDGFCQAEPAMDLALFTTTIKNMVCLTTRGPKSNGAQLNEMAVSETQLAQLVQAEALCDLFVAEYAKHAAVSPTRVVLWETVYLLSLLLGSWKKLKLERLAYCRFLLDRHLKRHGLG